MGFLFLVLLFILIGPCLYISLHTHTHTHGEREREMLLQRTTEEIYRRLSLSFFGKESVKKNDAICLFKGERDF